MAINEPLRQKLASSNTAYSSTPVDITLAPTTRTVELVDAQGQIESKVHFIQTSVACVRRNKRTSLQDRNRLDCKTIRGPRIGGHRSYHYSRSLIVSAQLGVTRSLSRCFTNLVEGNKTTWQPDNPCLGSIETKRYPEGSRSVPHFSAFLLMVEEIQSFIDALWNPCDVSVGFGMNSRAKQSLNLVPTSKSSE